MEAAAPHCTIAPVPEYGGTMSLWELSQAPTNVTLLPSIGIGDRLVLFKEFGSRERLKQAPEGVPVMHSAPFCPKS